MNAKQKKKVKNIAIIAAAVVVLAVLIFFAAQTPDLDLDGTWGHGAETIVFDGNNFEVERAAGGHGHFRTGTGTFEIDGRDIIFTFDDDDEVITRRFEQVGNSFRIDGHGYNRR